MIKFKELGKISGSFFIDYINHLSLLMQDMSGVMTKFYTTCRQVLTPGQIYLGICKAIQKSKFHGTIFGKIFDSDRHRCILRPRPRDIDVNTDPDIGHKM